MLTCTAGPPLQCATLKGGKKFVMAAEPDGHGRTRLSPDRVKSMGRKLVCRGIDLAIAILVLGCGGVLACSKLVICCGTRVECYRDLATVSLRS
jgi:hypothetical protein